MKGLQEPSNLPQNMHERPTIPTLHWVGGIDGHLRLIDQTRLPLECVEIDCRDVQAVWQAIRTLQVRGAPAIGIAAAFGICLGLQSALEPKDERTETQLFARLNEVAAQLATSRPTAVNLFWALERMKRCALALRGNCPPLKLRETLLAEAQLIWDQDRALCRAIGTYGAALLGDGQGVLTHCNAGALVTVDYGTALAPIFT